MKKYLIDDLEYVLVPLSYFDLLDLPEIFINALKAYPDDGQMTPDMLYMALKDQIKILIARQLGIAVQDLKVIPADVGMQITADFLEMNLNENFTSALSRAIKAGRAIYSKLLSS